MPGTPIAAYLFAARRRLVPVVVGPGTPIAAYLFAARRRRAASPGPGSTALARRSLLTGRVGTRAAQ